MPSAKTKVRQIRAEGDGTEGWKSLTCPGHAGHIWAYSDTPP